MPQYAVCIQHYAALCSNLQFSIRANIIIHLIAPQKNDFHIIPTSTYPSVDYAAVCSKYTAVMLHNAAAQGFRGF